MLVVGVDPGKTGAIVALRRDLSVAWAIRMPLLRGTRDIDSAEIFARLTRDPPVLVLQEFVSSRPGNGVKQAFEFGRAAEVCRSLSIAAGAPFETVTPATWQRMIPDLYPGVDRQDLKSIVTRFALRVWPLLPIRCGADQGMADAACVAAVAVRVAEHRKLWRSENSTDARRPA